MVVLFGLSLLSLLGGNAVASQAIPSDCRDSRESDNEACAQPIEPVVAVTPRSFYTAKIRCYDCPYYGWHGEPRIGSMRELMFGDHDLVSQSCVLQYWTQAYRILGAIVL
jgi:hypothetical protein